MQPVTESSINLAINVRFGRAALVALLVGVSLILIGPLTGLVYADAVGFLRETHGVGRTFFAARNFLNFLNGGLPNLVALQAIAVAFILAGLSRGR